MGPTSVVRSSLEEILESLRAKEEKPKDSPPALPPRPTSKGRLPSQRRSLPVNFKVEENGSKTEEPGTLKGDSGIGFVTSVFGSKRKANVYHPEASPYESVPRFVPGKGPLSLLDEKFVWSGNGNKVLKKEPRVWCKLPNTDWVPGHIQSIKGEYAAVILLNGNVLTVSVENILPANPDILDDVDDLVNLSYLNVPSVLHALKCQYSRDMIYTNAGNMLVVINPYKEVPLYGSDIVAAYRQKKVDRPHVYAVADSAYNGMMQDGVDQSIIISGESGAGKTETARVAMQYLATAGGDSGIEHKILQANIILEAFGNAKTSKNDNSSRFGKFVELFFNKGGKSCGAKFQTFLLEKARVVKREKGERSYHIFYQLCAGASNLLKEKLNLKAAEEYKYLNQSDCLKIDNMDDSQRLHKLMEALDTVNISKEDQDNVFAMLAAVLWLGNIEFEIIDSENHVEVMTNEGVTSAAKSIGCKVSDLKLALSTRKFQQGNGSTVEKLTLSQATDNRDALASSIYVCLFHWLVEQINKSLRAEQELNGRSISILDIYGFESFERNGFEQFYINYANERLRQHFSRHLLKLEQEEYIREGIDWSNIEYTDNNECLNLFEKRPVGLLSLLDEESRFEEASDLTFTQKLKEHLGSNPFYKAEKGGSFRIRHSVGEVVYDSSSFLEKNRDRLHSDSVELMSSCHCLLSKLFASSIFDQSRNPFSSENQSVGSKFKAQLFKLMQCLENTVPHFITCIKPNGNKRPGTFDKEHVLQQLRYHGILEIAKISKVGYPFQIIHQSFAERYGFLLLKNVASEDPLSIAVSILMKFNVPPEMYRVGYTKLFFRTKQMDALENIRNHTIQGILSVQKCQRGLQARRMFQELKTGATTFQSFIRGHLVRKNFIAMKNVGPKVHRKHVRIAIDGNLQGVKDGDKDMEHPRVESSIPAELEMLVLKTQATLRQKEEENNKLREQLQEYEVRMGFMEEAWKKQQTSQQTETLSTHLNYDSDISSVDPTPGGTTPIKHTSNGAQDAVGYLMKEYEQRKQAFDNEARILVEMRSGSSGNSDEDLRKLKAQFVAWKKDYKLRLRDAKAALQKVGDGDKAWKKWWIMKSVKL